MPSPLSIRHNAAGNRFEAEINGQLAIAAYRREGDRILFTHTEVPPSLRGGGVAAQLVQAALEEAARQKLRVVPLCSYVARYVQRHPEFAPLVDSGK